MNTRTHTAPQLQPSESSAPARAHTQPCAGTQAHAHSESAEQKSASDRTPDSTRTSAAERKSRHAQDSTRTAETLAAVDSFVIFVHQERCAKVRNRNVACLKCAQACTSGCIALVDGELVVDPARCVGCGTCATVCPTCALETRNPSDAALLSTCLAARRNNRVIIACQPARHALEGLADASALAPVVCAGRVDESLLVQLVAAGTSDVVVLCGECERCAQRYGHATAQMVADTAQRIFDAWQVDMSVQVTSDIAHAPLTCDLEAARAAVAARTANAHIAATPIAHSPHREPEASSAPHAMRVMKDGTLPHFLPDRRERLLDALAQLGEPRHDSLSCRLWGTVVINGSACVSCRMCATFCPTGAIVKFDEENGTIGVSHFPADCVKCGSCQDICPAHAIVLRDDVKVRYLLEGQRHRYDMTPRPVSLRNNPHQILDTMRLTFNGDLFER